MYVPFEIFLLTLSLRVVTDVVVVVVVVLSSDRFLVAVGLFSGPDVFLAVLDTFLLLFTRVLFCGTFLDSLNCLPGGLLAFDIPEIIRFFNPNDYLKNLCIKTSSLLMCFAARCGKVVCFVCYLFKI